MDRSRSSSFAKRRSFYPLALLALLLTSLSPQGFMPQNTDNGFVIQLCSGHTNSALTISPEHPDYALLSLVYGERQDKEESPQDHLQDGSICDFAAASNVSLSTSETELIPLKTLAPAYSSANRRQFAIINRIDIPPATGPPIAS